MKKNFKKLLTFASVVTMLLSSTLISHAGWVQDNVGWWYQNADGTYPVSSWYWIDGNNDGISECYYFDEIGYCLLNTTTPDGYMVDANGAWIVDGIIQTQVIAPPPQVTVTEAVTTDTAVTAVVQPPVVEWHKAYPYVAGMTQDALSGYNYVVNVNTGKVHWSGCSSVSQMNADNTWYFKGAFADLTANGYDSCGRCHAK